MGNYTEKNHLWTCKTKLCWETTGFLHMLEYLDNDKLFIIVHIASEWGSDRKVTVIVYVMARSSYPLCLLSWLYFWLVISCLILWLYPLLSCCHFLLPAHLRCWCSVSHLCSPLGRSSPPQLSHISLVSTALFPVSHHLHLISSLVEFVFKPVLSPHSLLVHLLSLSRQSCCNPASRTPLPV